MIVLCNHFMNRLNVECVALVPKSSSGFEIVTHEMAAPSGNSVIELLLINPDPGSTPGSTPDSAHDSKSKTIAVCHD